MIIDSSKVVSGKWALKGIDVCILSRLIKELPPTAQVIPNQFGNLVVRLKDKDIGFISFNMDDFVEFGSENQINKAEAIKTKIVDDLKPLGWTDTSDPNGIGYRIMTEDGIKVYDKDEYEDFCIERKRILIKNGEVDGR